MIYFRKDEMKEMTKTC